MTYSVTVPGKVTFTVQRRKGTRYVKVGTFTRSAAKSGAVRFVFRGRAGRRKLAVGTYRLSAVFDHGRRPEVGDRAEGVHDQALSSTRTPSAGASARARSAAASLPGAPAFAAGVSRVRCPPERTAAQACAWALPEAPPRGAPGPSGSHPGVWHPGWVAWVGALADDRPGHRLCGWTRSSASVPSSAAVCRRGSGRPGLNDRCSRMAGPSSSVRPDHADESDSLARPEIVMLRVVVWRAPSARDRMMCRVRARARRTQRRLTGPPRSMRSSVPRSAS